MVKSAHRGRGALLSLVLALVATLWVGRADAETANYYYDAAGRLTGVVDSATGTASYTLDAAGNVKSIVWHSTLFIGGFAPAQGAVGTSVTIGGNFGSATSSNTSVTINGTPATLTNVTATALTVTVPAGASTGPVSVTIGTSSYTTPSTLVFTVPVTAPAPTISSLSPGQGTILAPGASFTVNGSNFVPGDTVVTLNGQFVHIIAATTAKLTVTVPSLNPTTGHITVSTPNGQVTSAGYVTVPAPGYTTSQISKTVFTTLGTSVPVSGSGGYEQVVFDVAAGQMIEAQLTAATALGDQFLLFGPGGALLSTISASNGGLFLPVGSMIPGSYTLLFQASSSTDTGTLKASLQPAPVTAQFTLGSTTWPSLAITPGQLGEVTFTATAGQRIGVVIDLTNYVNYYFLILDPSGNTIYNSIGGAALYSPSNDSSGALPIKTTGTYTLVIDYYGTSGTLGNETFTTQIYSVPPDITQSVATNGTPTAPITPATPDQNVIFMFTATAGTNIELGNFGGFGWWYLKDPNGNIIYTPHSPNPQYTSVIPVTITGTYQIVNYNLYYVGMLGTGTVTAVVWTVPTNTIQTIMPTTSGTLVSPTVIPGQLVNYTFQGTQGNAISLVETNGSYPFSLQLIEPNGTSVQPASLPQGGYIDDLTLSSTGTYTVQLSAQPAASGGNATGSFTLYSVPPAPDGAIGGSGTPVTAQVSVPGQVVQLTYPVSQQAITAGTRFSLYAAVNGNLGSFARGIYGGSNSGEFSNISVLAPDQTTTLYTSATGFNINNDIFTGALPASTSGLLTEAGNYTITFTPQLTTAQTGSVTFELWAVPPDVTGTIGVNNAATNYTLTTPGQNLLLNFTPSTTQQSVSVHVNDPYLNSLQILCYQVQVSYTLGSSSVPIETTTECQEDAILGSIGVTPGAQYTITVSPLFYDNIGSSGTVNTNPPTIMTGPLTVQVTSP
jgi:YD repeat-containing protein